MSSETTSTPTLLCDQCELAEIQVTCPTCEEQYCLACDEKRHQSRKSKSHPRFLSVELEQKFPKTEQRKFDSTKLNSPPPPSPSYSISSSDSGSSGRGSPSRSPSPARSASSPTPTFSRFCTTSVEHKDIEMNLFCQTCFQLICSHCILDAHREHTYVPLNSAVDKVKDSLTQTLAPLRLQITKRIEMIKLKEGEKEKRLKEINEQKSLLQKEMKQLEEMERLIGKTDLDSFTFLSMVSELKPQESDKGHILEPLAEWLKKPREEWKLLYQWSKDGKTAKAFHERCDDQGPTVTVVWANNGYVFGGYAAVPWQSPPGDILIGHQSKESFLFSLVDPTNPKRKPLQCFPSANMQACLFHHSNYGPIWGYENDLYLGLALEDPDEGGSELRRGEKNNFSSCLGGTYELPDGYTDPKTFLAGKERGWQVEEMEVYSV